MAHVVVVLPLKLREREESPSQGTARLSTQPTRTTLAGLGNSTDWRLH